MATVLVVILLAVMTMAIAQEVSWRQRLFRLLNNVS